MNVWGFTSGEFPGGFPPGPTPTPPTTEAAYLQALTSFIAGTGSSLSSPTYSFNGGNDGLVRTSDGEQTFVKSGLKTISVGSQLSSSSHVSFDSMVLRSSSTSSFNIDNKSSSINISHSSDTQPIFSSNSTSCTFETGLSCTDIDSDTFSCQKCNIPGNVAAIDNMGQFTFGLALTGDQILKSSGTQTELSTDYTVNFPSSTSSFSCSSFQFGQTGTIGTLTASSSSASFMSANGGVLTVEKNTLPGTWLTTTAVDPSYNILPATVLFDGTSNTNNAYIYKIPRTLPILSPIIPAYDTTFANIKFLGTVGTNLLQSASPPNCLLFDSRLTSQGTITISTNTSSHAISTTVGTPGFVTIPAIPVSPDGSTVTSLFFVEWTGNVTSVTSGGGTTSLSSLRTCIWDLVESLGAFGSTCGTRNFALNRYFSLTSGGSSQSFTVLVFLQSAVAHSLTINHNLKIFHIGSFYS